MSRDNSGSMSRNERKEKSSHADYKGKATIGGKEYWISGWKKENEKGQWLSLAFDLKKEEPTRTTEAPRRKESDSAW